MGHHHHGGGRFPFPYPYPMYNPFAEQGYAERLRCSKLKPGASTPGLFFDENSNEWCWPIGYKPLYGDDNRPSIPTALLFVGACLAGIYLLGKKK